MARRGTD